MSAQPSSQVPLFGLVLIKAASFLVPWGNRREWTDEWRSEAWYVHKTQSERSCTNEGTILFCLGAFKDAFWLRANLSPKERSPLFESPQECFSTLALVAVASLTLMFFIPGTRQALLAHSVPSPKGLVLISPAGAIESGAQNMPFADYSVWKSRTLRRFSDFAFYQHTRSALRTTGGGDPQNLTLLLASGNLPRLLHTAVSASALEAARAQHLPTLALSSAAWNKYFDGDPDILGRSVDLEGHQVVVASILPDDAWWITGRPDAWLLQDDASLAAQLSKSQGYIIGQLASSTPSSQTRGGWEFSLGNGHGYDTFSCHPLVVRVNNPWITFLFTLFLACAALPATTPLPLGDYPAAKHPLFAAMRWRRWIFLLAKIVLAVLIVYCISTSLAYADTSLAPNSSVYIQFAASFLGLLFSFRWALRDQRRRCPVCLRILTRPVQVGQPSRNFLAWHGTEFMCEKGHGLLHIPEMATSWFSTQRWLSLDSSWQGLFPKTYLPSSSLF